jgi:MFS family permease
LLCASVGMLGLVTGSLPVMIAGSLLIGIGYAFNNPCSSHMLHGQTPARLRNIIFSIKQAGVPAGGVLAALAISPLTEAFGFHIALALSAIPCLVLGMLLASCEIGGMTTGSRKPGLGAAQSGRVRSLSGPGRAFARFPCSASSTQKSS